MKKERIEEVLVFLLGVPFGVAVAFATYAAGVYGSAFWSIPPLLGGVVLGAFSSRVAAGAAVTIVAIGVVLGWGALVFGALLVGGGAFVGGRLGERARRWFSPGSRE